MGDENMREQDGPDRGGMEWERNEKDLLVEGLIMGLGRNLVLGKFPGIHKDDSR